MMYIYIKQAVRNVHKNIGTVWLNGLGIALTVMMVILIFSLSRGIESQIVMRNIKFETGAIRLNLKKELSGYENKVFGDEEYSTLLNLMERMPEISGYRQRVVAYNALLYAVDATQRVKIEGVSVDELPLLNEAVGLLEGSADWGQVSNGMLISQGLAEEAGLSVGDDCSVMIQSADGTVNIGDFSISGFFLNTSQANKYTVYTSYLQAKELYHTNLPTHLLIDLTDLEQADRIKKQLILETRHPWIGVESYTDHLSTAQALSNINKYSLAGMVFFLLLISFAGIWAMEIENINERRKEIGTLLAFGFSRRVVKRIFLCESFYISLLSLVTGLAVILLLLSIIHLQGGVYLGSSASFAFGSSIICPVLNIKDVLWAASVAILYPLLATWLSLSSINSMRIIKLLNEK
ncbi:putative ABC transport system permease protein [Parabacteroides sp. PF5-5]|uniref:ABC transporter permease n=1 Tax=unclassified Parabacteroides TaxID=2649774 RepID=UPI00247407D8|nr:MULTISPECIES: FtsX-like permease family protein [unclassified Parabacteroides]MDH6316691.1 putative ABC transport system permease protein [Parabacteroides sp. PF5-13]MDH6327806.1 putative ABC transport system permease protein [Parabacteroides sp. PH5-41]MDH6335678.1 putative ABC transport system permease protein [Parabacteroides sp. PF5-5]MDH6346670.1 putative ABC transport system permease protein [Parabacteroides sp. PH5-46]MDH6361704.1 putative ABC transport system permease protein [Parab